jgi:hypothetical protein
MYSKDSYARTPLRVGRLSILWLPVGPFECAGLPDNGRLQ